ncbi:hypothetical protein DK37_28245 [Halomonas sp. SUBG004]|nr:hypothetical protein DK37_28245 [Halomonas sp. SUBG004]
MRFIRAIRLFFETHPMNAIARAIDAFNEVFGRLIAPLLAVITIIVIYDITMRFVAGRQVTGL